MTAAADCMDLFSILLGTLLGDLTLISPSSLFYDMLSTFSIKIVDSSPLFYVNVEPLLFLAAE
jgi:hypothetical protein